MTLLDDLLDSGHSAPEGWLDATIVAARNKTTSEGALAALDILEANKEDFVHLGNAGLVVVMAHLAAGDFDKATSAYIREKATLKELLAISGASNEVLLEAARIAKEAKKDALAALIRIGVFTAKYVLPLLIGLI